MKTAKSASVLDQLVASLGDCLTPESARRLLALKADRKLQARVAAFWTFFAMMLAPPRRRR